MNKLLPISMFTMTLGLPALLAGCPPPPVVDAGGDGDGDPGDGDGDGDGDPGDGDGDGDGDVVPPVDEVVDYDWIPLDELPQGELEIERVRAFQCNPTAVQGELVINQQLAGAPGEQLFIQPDAGECQYQLFHRDALGTETQLSAAASGYLLTAGARVGDRLVVCASDIEHGSMSGGATGEHEIDAVPVRCAVQSGAGFGAWTSVVGGTSEWAAWIRTVAPGSEPNTAVLTYARDFSFQFMNQSDNGRPATDGVYRVTLTFDDAGAVSASEPELVTALQNQLADVTVHNGWDPSDAEKEAYGDFINFDEGPCEGGCSMAE